MSNISNDTLIRKFARYKGEVLPTERVHSLAPLMHFFLVDLADDIFTKNWKDHDLTQESSSMRNDILSTFFWHNKDFFFAFNQDDTDAILEKVNDLQAYIGHDVFIADIAGQETINELEAAEQKSFSSLWLTNILCANAQDLYAHNHEQRSRIKIGKTRKVFNKDINTLLRLTRDLAEREFPGGEVDERKYDRVLKAERALAIKIMRWMEMDEAKDKELYGTV